MTYQVLARAYRPRRFADLVGQEGVVRTLQNALGSGTLGQAYLFSGLRGVGKTTVARLLAMAVNCERGPAPEPCGECVSCREIVEGSSLDVVELDAATHTGVDNVRDIQEMLRYRPTRDRYRVMIVDEVHMLSRAAFNALLKTIEEPPPYILWIFATTERHKVPPTILSRCQQLEFRPVPAARIAEHLASIAEKEGFGLTGAAASAVARAAEGSLRDALSLLDQLRAFSGESIDEEAVATVLGVPPADRVARLLGHLVRGEIADALGTLRGELAAGHDPVVLYHELGRALRQMVHLTVDPELADGLEEQQVQRLREATGGLDATALTRMLGLWVEQEPLLRDAANRELVLEVACLRLARWPAVQAVESLLAGGGPVSPPDGSQRSRGAAASSAGGGGGSAAAPHGGAEGRHPPGSPGHRLAELLWPRSPRVAGAVEEAEVILGSDTVKLVLPASHAPLAAYLRNPDVVPVVEEAVRSAFGEGTTVVIRVEGAEGTEGDPGLRTSAEADEGVALARRVLGGEVVRVVPDRRGDEA